jgi:hypothetical protein
MSDEEKKLQKEHVKYLRELVVSNRPTNQLVRGCVFGLASAVGTTVGLALFLVFAVQLIAGIKDFPIVKDLLAQTKLDQLIEKQLDNINGPSQKPVVYTDESKKFTFTYPAFLSYQITDQREGGRYVLLQQGDGPLSTLEVYVDVEPKVASANVNVSRYQITAQGQNTEYTAYYNGATVEDVQHDLPVFVYKVDLGNTKLTLVGIAEADAPQVAREVFKQIISSVGKFN